MMANDKKKSITLIMNKMRGKPEEMTEAPTNEMGDEVDDSMGLDTAAEEILSAVASKDAKALKEALKSFMEMCDSAEDMAETEE